MDIANNIRQINNHQRRLFDALEEIDITEISTLAAVWRGLMFYLSVNMDAKERIFYPHLARVGLGATGAGNAEAEAITALQAHDRIRSKIADLDRLEIGYPEWFVALQELRNLNSDHIALEESQNLADFRRRATLNLRHELAIEFLAFQCDRLISGKSEIN
ncbi:hemerythrin domain-containing protein [Loktanella sp. M215]|uniref:hemerythrin domain-containing protein n=1 Tax=Loktanella sp. M215 TaxID=2675431 RepID=UPI001F1C71EE|nr:cation-binding protein [Loktanella sp. M215]